MGLSCQHGSHGCILCRHAELEVHRKLDIEMLLLEGLAFLAVRQTRVLRTVAGQGQVLTRVQLQPASKGTYMHVRGMEVVRGR